MHSNKPNIIFAVPIIISVLLSSTMTVRVMADDETPEPGGTQDQPIVTVEDGGTPEPGGTQDQPFVTVEDDETPEPGGTQDQPFVTVEDGGTPELRETDTGSIPVAVPEIEVEEVSTMLVEESPASYSNDLELDLLETQALLSEDIPLVVVVDGQIEPLVTVLAAEAVFSGDPIWCPESSLPDPGFGGCTSSYGTLEALINDIKGGVITEPNDHGVIWILTGQDLSASPVEIDSGDYTNWGSFRLTIQGGWTGTPAGIISGESIFSVPISVVDWINTVSINDIYVKNTNGTGITIDIQADVTFDNVSSNGNQGLGADITTLLDVYLEGGSEFNDNNGSGLLVDAGGDVSIQNSSAETNGNIGMDITAVGGVSIVNAILLNNAGTGLLVDAGGDISLEAVNAESNDNIGIDLVSGGAIILTSLNVFGNGDTGLLADAPGDISLQNSAFDDNTNIGVDLFAGGNIFITNVTASLNGDTGIRADAGGLITASDLTANSNGDGGIWGSGAEFYTPGSLSLSGSNTFINNLSDGLYTEADGGISIQNTTANGNLGSGYYLGTNGNAYAVCGQTLGNGYLQIDTSMSGMLTLTGLDFGGDPDNNVGIDSSQLVLVSNGCFVYPDYYSDSGDEDSGEDIPTPPSSLTYVFEFEGLSLRSVLGTQGEVVGLDCIRYSGTVLILENGDGVLVPCPIVDTVSLERLEAEEPPLPLPDGYSYVSGMDVYVSNNGRTFTPVELPDVVWFFTEDNGYQATYYDGTGWADVTDQILPFLKVFFVVPDSARDKDLAIMYWDGIGWVELVGGLDLGNGRLIGNVGMSSDNRTYQGFVNFIGLFILVEK